MELDLSSSQEFYLKKHVFNLKTNRSDGLVLQVHHAYSDSGEGNQKFRFIYSSFSSSGNHLAVSDQKGHIFIINLESQRYWQLPQVGISTLISFTPSKNQELLIGLGSTSVILVDIESGNAIGVLSGHTVPATEVSYSDDGCYYLTSCSAEAIVWDSSTFSQIHKLTLKLDTSLKKVLFMPVTNHILACFQDDTMHIWKFGNFECMKQIIPETWKTHDLSSIAFTKNGRTMIIGGQGPTLVTFCLEIWDVKNVIELPESTSGVKQMEFLSEVFDGGANKILVVLTTSYEIFFFDTESFVTLKFVSQIRGLAAKFSLSCNGLYLAVILTTGEVNIYSVDKVLWSKSKTTYEKGRHSINRDSASRIHSSNSKRSQKTSESLGNVQREIKDILNLKKLLPILKQFGEYPQNYRRLIWKTILKLPENKDCFVALSLKKCHPSYSKIDLKYPLANTSLCISLKKLLSNLSYWCPLFGEVDFLPEFVFPFVKLFHSSPLICFEVVGTIIVNWCQNWFEFYPFPPINILSSLESVLGFHDPDLLEFYLTKNITSGVSVCPLFHTAFSEVLSKSEWLKLWDHILSNEPSFLFMAIVAYNIVCRNTIKNLKDAAEVEKYFHTQNPVDLKMVISKAYQFLKDTPEDIHTRQFFAPFRSFGSGGTYVSFLSYPKLICDSTTEKLQVIRKEEEKVLEEQFKALNVKKALEEKLQQDDTAEEKKKIYRELEEKIRDTVEEEEDRLLIERQKLQKLRQELKLKELQVLENTRDKVLKEKILQKKIEYDRLVKDISKRKHREKLEVDTVEKEIKSYYSDLLLRKTQLELDLGLNSECKVSDNLQRQREMLQKDLTDLQYEWDSDYHSRRIDISNKIAAIKSLICDVEGEIAKEMAEKKWEKDLKGDRTFVGELKNRVISLENEVESLMRENINNCRSRLTHSWSPAKPETNKPTETYKPERRHEPNDEVNNEETTQGGAKLVPQKPIPGSRPIAKRNSPRPKLPKPIPKDCSNEKKPDDLPPEVAEGILESPKLKLGSEKGEGPQKRSKYTQPHELRLSNSDPSEDFYGTNPEMQHHQQPKGDCLCVKKISTVPKFYKNEFVSNFKIIEGKDGPKSSVHLSNSTDEIFKSALRIRSEIIEDAKRQHEIARKQSEVAKKL